MKRLVPILQLLVTAALFALATRPVCAGELHATLRSVLAMSHADQAGVLSFLIDADAFPTATPETPVFIYVHLEDGAVLAETLVDLDRPELGRFSHPIFVPLEPYSPMGGVVVAPPDTLSIVRWIQGESGYWLRIQRPSRTWLLGDEGPTAPGPLSRVRWSIGISASRSYLNYGILYEQQQVTLPYHTRQNPFDTNDASTFAVSTLLCVDLREARLETSPRTRGGSRLIQLVSAFTAVPEQITASEAVPDLDQLITYPIAFTNEAFVGMGFGVACQSAADSDRVRVDLCGLPADRTVAFDSQWSFSVSCDLAGTVHRLTRWTLAFPAERRVGFLVADNGQGGFVDAEAASDRKQTVMLVSGSFSSQALGAAYADRANLFQVGTQWYAHTAEARTNDRWFSFDATTRAYAAGQAALGTVSATVRSYPTNRETTVDDEPNFQGPDQPAFCGPSEVLASTTEHDVVVLEACPNR